MLSSVSRAHNKCALAPFFANVCVSWITIIKPHLALSSWKGHLGIWAYQARQFVIEHLEYQQTDTLSTYVVIIIRINVYFLLVRLHVLYIQYDKHAPDSAHASNHPKSKGYEPATMLILSMRNICYKCRVRIAPGICALSE